MTKFGTPRGEGPIGAKEVEGVPGAAAAPELAPPDGVGAVCSLLEPIPGAPDPPFSGGALIAPESGGAACTPPPPIGVPGTTTGGVGLAGVVGSPEPVPAVPELAVDAAPAMLPPATTAIRMARATVSASLCLI